MQYGCIVYCARACMKYRLHVSCDIEIPRLGLLRVFMSTMYKAVQYTVKTLRYMAGTFIRAHFTLRYSMQELYYSVLRSQVSRSFWLNALIDEIFDVRALQLIHWLPCVMAPTIAHPPNDPFHARRRGGGGAGARKGPNVPFHAWRRGGGAR